MTKACTTCKECKPIKNFPKNRTKCYSCKYADSKDYLSRVEIKERMRNYGRHYHLRHGEVARYKSLVHSDKKKGRENPLTLVEYRDLIQNPCTYCGKEGTVSIDRIDSTKGHTLENSVPCCEKCNIILTDLPKEVKEVLKPCMKIIQEKNLLEHWIIPTKRRST